MQYIERKRKKKKKKQERGEEETHTKGDEEIKRTCRVCVCV
jgi:hypothetical protein